MDLAASADITEGHRLPRGRFRRYLHDDPAVTGTAWLRLVPASLTAKDLSYIA